MARELVTKANSLITASYHLSLAEGRLILLAIAQAKGAVTSDTELEITAQHYADVFDISKNAAYMALKDGADNLFERQFSYYETDKHGNQKIIKSRWVSQVAYKESEGSVFLKFSPAVISTTQQLKEKFTVYELRQTNQLKSSYAYRLYEYLTSWKNAGKTPVCSLEDLKRNLGWDVDRPILTTNFKRLLNKAVGDINTHTNLTTSYEQKKRGRMIVGFIFHVSENKPVSEESETLELSPYMRNKYTQLLINAVRAEDRVVQRYLFKFPESQRSYDALEQAVYRTLGDPKKAVTLLPALIQVGYYKQRRKKRVPRDEDGKPIIEDTISANFDF